MIDIYFCDPYKSYQKGSIENGNKMIRTKLSRKSDINTYSQLDIEIIIDKFNNRPMKCLAYKTPAEVFNEHLKNSFSVPEWKIAFEFAKEIENERMKKSFIEGGIVMCKSLNIN